MKQVDDIGPRLSERDLHAIAARAEAAELASAEACRGLLAGLDPAVQGRLPERRVPAEHLLSHVQALNAGDARWLGSWLRAAERRVPATERAWWSSWRQRVHADGPAPASDLRPALVVIPAGRFSRGSLTDEFGHFSDEAPLHRVKITRSLLMGRTPVTRGQYRALVERHPSAGADDAPVTACAGWTRRGTATRSPITRVWRRSTVDAAGGGGRPRRRWLSDRLRGLMEESTRADSPPSRVIGGVLAGKARRRRLAGGRSRGRGFGTKQGCPTTLDSKNKNPRRSEGSCRQ